MTITLDETVYDGLYRVVGKRRISQFIEDLLRPHVSDSALDSGYRAMAADSEREAEAHQWLEALANDGHDEAGEVWWVEFDPSVGSEVRKTRPAVIVSNDAANRHLPRVIAMPLTSNTARVYPGEAIVTVEGRKSKAMADQIMAADKRRLTGRLGALSRPDLLAIEDALKLHLGLSR